MQLEFHTLDVFTTAKFSGNPLAVVLGAERLSTEQMQTITREFNLSETTFVMAPENPANTAKVRIFFPGGEMPFAGHPTLGTAILLASLRNKPECNFETEIRLELKAGLTPVRVSRIAGRAHGMFTAPVIPFAANVPLPAVADVAQALSLALEDIGFDGHGLASLEGGPRFFYVPVKSRAALEKSQVREPYWSALLKPMAGVDAAYLYTRGGDGPQAAFRARMYAPTGGIPEDPATGSATALLAAQLLKAERLADGRHAWQLEQGYEMGRPSDLRLEADVQGGKLAAVRVGGGAVHMMSGEIEL
ncbi:MAG: PhzF family phenazine biosynthesis protein [Alphaproteobacteria bacterium]|nr:PhzF family phenazine biosynthesis protein [Alphaproteobacteria bacterium]